MDSTVVVALISGLCVGVPSVIATISSNKKTTSLIEHRVKELEKKVEKHNGVIERQFRLEEQLKGIEHEIEIYHK